MAVPAIHPGEHLAEELKALNMSAAALARHLKVPTNRITEILNGERSITGDTALRLAGDPTHPNAIPWGPEPGAGTRPARHPDAMVQRHVRAQKSLREWVQQLANLVWNASGVSKSLAKKVLQLPFEARSCRTWREWKRRESNPILARSSSLQIR